MEFFSKFLHSLPRVFPHLKTANVASCSVLLRHNTSPALPCGLCSRSFHGSATCLIKMPKEPKVWPTFNEKVYSPTPAGETPRKAFVCHVLKNVKYSRKKMWYVASMIRGLSVEDALSQLRFVRKKGSAIATRAIQEAQEMAVRDHNVEFKTNLWVAESFATSSYMLKGYRRHARGRMGVIHYRYIHYFIRLEEGEPPAQYYLDAPPSLPQMLDTWMDNKRRRNVTLSL